MQRRAEVLTQLARVVRPPRRLRGGRALLDEAKALAARPRIVARARIDLERGRLATLERRTARLPPALRVGLRDRRSSGRQCFVAADAAHMAALAATATGTGFARLDAAWHRARRGATTTPRTGSARSSTTSAGSTTRPASYEPALDAFERALRAREREPSNSRGRSRSRAMQSGRRSGARPRGRGDPAPRARPSRGRSREGAPDGWFHEELAEEYAAVGRDNERASRRASRCRSSSATTRRSRTTTGGERAWATSRAARASSREPRGGRRATRVRRTSPRRARAT